MSDTRRVEYFIGMVLRGGVLMSSALVSIGSVMLLASSLSGQSLPLLTFAPTIKVEELNAFRSLNEVSGGLSRLDPNAIITAGLLLLMATPVLSVLLSGVSFALQKDKPFIFITLFVLSILAASFFFGFTA